MIKKKLINTKLSDALRVICEYNEYINNEYLTINPIKAQKKCNIP
jgi:hypothetical protein